MNSAYKRQISLGMEDIEIDKIPQVQARIVTTDDRFKISKNILSLPVNVTPEHLRNLVLTLLDRDDKEDVDIPQFNFVTRGSCLEDTLESLIKEKELDTEPQNQKIHWTMTTGFQLSTAALTSNYSPFLYCYVINGRIITGCYDNCIRIYDAQKSELETTIPAHTAPVKCIRWLKFAGDNTLFLSASHDQTLQLWRWSKRTKSANCLSVYKGHAASVDCIAVHPGGTKFVSGSWDKMLKLWSCTEEPSEEETTQSGDDGARAPKRKRGADNQPAHTRLPMVTLSGHNEAISAAAWISSDQVVTSSWDHSLRLWDMNGAQHVRTLAGSKVFLDLSFSQEHQCVLTGSADRHVRLYDLRSTDGTLVKQSYTSHNGWVSGVRWAPHNENLFVTASYDKLVKLWDLRSPTSPLYDLKGHEDKVLCVDWSQSKQIISGSSDGTLKIFNSNS